jgi:hypothetical protein
MKPPIDQVTERDMAVARGAILRAVMADNLTLAISGRLPSPEKLFDDPRHDSILRESVATILVAAGFIPAPAPCPPTAPETDTDQWGTDGGTSC